MMKPLLFQQIGTSGDQPAELGIIVGGVLMGMLLITGMLFIFFRKRKARKPIVKEEINDTYGDYYADPNAVVEMADNNDYYSGDYEAGTTATRDNIPNMVTRPPLSWRDLVAEFNVPNPKCFFHRIKNIRQ